MEAVGPVDEKRRELIFARSEAERARAQAAPLEPGAGPFAGVPIAVRFADELFFTRERRVSRAELIEALERTRGFNGGPMIAEDFGWIVAPLNSGRVLAVRLHRAAEALWRLDDALDATTRVIAKYEASFRK